MMSYPLDQSESHSVPLSWSELFDHFDERKAPNYEEPVVDVTLSRDHNIACLATPDVFFHVQWNLSNADTLGTEESVLITEVS